MDDQRFGIALRAARVRRRLTQRDVGRAAGVSDASVSPLERGFVDSMPLAAVRAIAHALDVRVELLPRSRAADLDRVASAAHAALAEAAVAWLGRYPGWEIRPEIGFSNYGERGVIDLVGWHVARRALLVVELKTELVDINELLGTLDRYARNAAVAVAPVAVAPPAMGPLVVAPPAIAPLAIAPLAIAPVGWRPAVVSRLLLVGESTHNRDRVAGHAALFAAALPQRGTAIRAWLRDPAGELAGLMFVRPRHGVSTTRRFATVRRVRRRTRPVAEHASGDRSPS